MDSTDYRHINLTNGEEFEARLDLLGACQRQNHEDAFSIKKRWENKSDRCRERYEANARFVIYANHTFAQKYCRCGMKSAFNGSGACGLSKWCSRCAEFKAWKAFQPFKASFRHGEFHFVTLSYSSSLSFGQKYESEQYWEAPMAALNNLQKRVLISGAIMQGEMAVTSFQPVGLQPHVHAIVHAPHWDDSNNEELERLINESLAATMGEGHRLSDVKAIPIDNCEGFETRFYYMMKAMNLVEAYESARILCHESPERLAALNEEVKEFVRAMPSITKEAEKQTNQRLLRPLGTMHSQSKSYIGDKSWKKPKCKRKQTAKPVCSGSGFNIPDNRGRNYVLNDRTFQAAPTTQRINSIALAA